MTKILVSSALFAGIAAGLIAALLQFWLVTPLLLEGEEYETGNKSHFAGVAMTANTHDHDAHSHDAVEVETTGEEAAEEPENMLVRHAKTFAVNLITFTGFGLILVAGFAFAARFGHTVTLQTGMIWGLLGFIALQLAPAAGLAPELPGTPAADVVARQYWWFSTVIASVIALAMIAFGKALPFVIAGIILLLVPHLIGAPELPFFAGVAPPELSALFVARTLFVAMIAWVVLGGVAGHFWQRGTENN
ncbi:MAG: CbtA family protein [Paracoccaceae bacterium]